MPAEVLQDISEAIVALHPKTVISGILVEKVGRETLY
jgi:hypothetical protein